MKNFNDEMEAILAECRLDWFRSDPLVNQPDTAVRLTHIETGTIIDVKHHKSRWKNKRDAIKMMAEKLGREI